MSQFVFPSGGDVQVNCSKCGSMSFGLHVTPVLSDARVTEVVCKNCKTVFRVEYGLLRGKLNDQARTTS